MKKQKLSAVVFDCGGVLIESNAIKILAMGKTVEEFGQAAMEQLMDYHNEHGGVSRFKKFEWFYREVIKEPLSDKMMATLCNRFTQICFDAVLNAPMVAGAEESLEFLSGRLPMFVASGAPEKELQDILLHRELAPYFKSIHRNKLDASEVLMVGDALTDLKAAQYCNSLFYGRGERFSENPVPWSEDLTGLVEYLSCNFDFTF